MSNIKTTVYLDEGDYRALQAIAAARAESAAELIREAVRGFVAAYGESGAVRRVAESSPRYRAMPEPAPLSVPPLPSVVARLAEIQAMVREGPVLDTRPADEILGYDAHGLPT